MSFEKKMQKRGNDKLNQFAKNPYHQEPVVTAPTPKVKRFPVWASVLIPSVAVACAIILIVPVMMSMGANGAMKAPQEGAANDSYAPVDYKDGTTSQDKAGHSYPGEEASQTTDPNTYEIPHWEDATINEKYPEFTYNSVKYRTHSTTDAQAIATSYINEKVADIEVSGYDIYENETHTINAGLYSIKNIALEVSLAIKFEGMEEYYSYLNYSVYFANIGELNDKLSFADTVIFKKITLHDYAANGEETITGYTGVATKDLTDVMFIDRTAKNTKSNKPKLNANDTSEGSHNSSGGTYIPPVQPGTYTDYIEFSTSIPCLGIDNVTTKFVEDNGKFSFNVFGATSFYLTESVFNATKEVLQTKGTVIN